MITSKEELEYFLEADRIASKRSSTSKIPFSDIIWRFQVHMRKTEYFHNLQKRGFSRIKYHYHKSIYNLLGVALNYSIPLNTCQEGLYLPHRGTIVISQYSRIGKNCVINVDVNVGKLPYGDKVAPILKDNIYIAPGVKIYGGIIVESGIAIGANAVVNKSFLECNITIAGVPAKKISESGTERFYK